MRRKRGQRGPTASKMSAAVKEFKKAYLTAALMKHAGNRTHTAAAENMQRTYLTRLIGELEIQVPAPDRSTYSPEL